MNDKKDQPTPSPPPPDLDVALILAYALFIDKVVYNPDKKVMEDLRREG